MTYFNKSEEEKRLNEFLNKDSNQKQKGTVIKASEILDGTFNKVESTDWYIPVLECMETFAQLYHKQELEKVLKEAGKELPDNNKIIDQLDENPGFIDDDSFAEGAKWMRDKAALVIAALKEEHMEWRIKHVKEWSLLRQEKDKLIAEKEEEKEAEHNKNLWDEIHELNAQIKELKEEKERFYSEIFGITHSLSVMYGVSERSEEAILCNSINEKLKYVASKYKDSKKQG